jgi:hypothetical protein
MPLSEGNATRSIDGDGLCRRKKDEAHRWNAMILFVRGHEVKEPNVAIVELQRIQQLFGETRANEVRCSRIRITPGKYSRAVH